MLDNATRSLGTTRVMSKVALMAGSSQQGKARRASVACDGEGARDGGGGVREKRGQRRQHQEGSNVLQALNSQPRHTDRSYDPGRSRSSPTHL